MAPKPFLEQFSDPPGPAGEASFKVARSSDVFEVSVPLKEARVQLIADIIAISATLLFYAVFRFVMKVEMSDDWWMLDLLLGIILLFASVRLAYHLIAIVMGSRVLRFCDDGIETFKRVPLFGERQFEDILYKNIGSVTVVPGMGLQVLDNHSGQLVFGSGFDEHQLLWLKSLVDQVKGS
ncbi:MAG: hypothetical protein BMS9Abin26_0474 [Gammaproteobacteria bacterium]|nr:MAG: hypothetical protein BMS9Abin26_0474 [Gammaproteobacteria bacterium]